MKVMKILIIFLGLLLPLFLSEFAVFQLTMVVIYAIAILGLNILTGLSGQYSLGHGAFFAIGAYVSAVLMSLWGVPYYLTIPIAAILCFIVGFLFGLPALRLDGAYLALATFALSLALPPIFKLSLFESVLGGSQGIIVDKILSPQFLPLSDDQWMYCFVFIIALILFWSVANIKNSRTGRSLMALRDNSVAAQSMGVSSAHYKSFAFGLSSAFTGIAGALATIVVQYVAPESYTIHFSIALMVGLVIGGVGSVLGPIAGGFFMMFVPNIAEEISKGLAGAVYGLMLLLFVFIMPMGFVGFIGSIVEKLTVVRKRRQS